jgi:pimeloyl-ACP methyl ester carboxylesterase
MYAKTSFRMAVQILIPIAAIYLVICILLFLFQRYLVFFPTKTIDATPNQTGLVYEDITLTTSDNIQLHGWLIPANNSRGLLIFCHGNAGNISHRLESIYVFNQLALDVLIFDYRGYGRSSGTVSEEGTYIDAETFWDYARKERQYQPDQIIIFGRSLGTGIASWLAKKKDPAAVILESSYTSLPDLGAKIYPIFPVRLLARIKYPVAENLPFYT